MKRIIAVILTFAVCFAAFCIPAAAASPKAKIKVHPSYSNGYTYVGINTYGATVYYTTNGTKPDRTDSKYTGLVKITKPCTLRMAVYSGGKVIRRCSAKIEVQTKIPDITVEANDKGKYTATITVPKGKTVYYTTNGKTPAKIKKNKLTETTEITVEPGTKIKAVAVQKGWKDSLVVTENVSVKTPEIPVAEEPAPEPTEDELLLNKLTELVNAERKRFYFDDATANSALSKVAQIRAEELASDYKRTRPDGRSFDTIFTENGIHYSAAVQGIAKNFDTAEEVFEYWKSVSELNQSFVDKQFNQIGLGRATSADGSENYWVLLVINKPYDYITY